MAFKVPCNSGHSMILWLQEKVERSVWNWFLKPRNYYCSIHRTVPLKSTSRIKRCFKMHCATVTLFLQNMLSTDSSKSFCIKQTPRLEQPAFFPPSWRRRGPHYGIPGLKKLLQRGKRLSFTRKHTREHKGQKVYWEKFHLKRKKYSKNNHSLEQLRLGCGRALITGNFQYVIGKSVRWSPLDSPPPQRLD